MADISHLTKEQQDELVGILHAMRTSGDEELKSDDAQNRAIDAYLARHPAAKPQQVQPTRTLGQDFGTFIDNTPLGLVKNLPDLASGALDLAQDPRYTSPMGGINAGMDLAKGLYEGGGDRRAYFANKGDTLGDIEGLISAVPILGDAMIPADKAIAPGMDTNTRREGIAGLLGQIVSLGLQTKPVTRGMKNQAVRTYSKILDPQGSHPMLTKKVAPDMIAHNQIATSGEGLTNSLASQLDAARAEKVRLENANAGRMIDLTGAPDALREAAKSMEVQGIPFDRGRLASATEQMLGNIEAIPPDPATVQLYMQHLGISQAEAEVAAKMKVPLRDAVKARQVMDEIANRGGAYRETPGEVIDPNISAEGLAAKAGADVTRDAINTTIPELGAANKDTARLMDANRLVAQTKIGAPRNFNAGHFLPYSGAGAGYTLAHYLGGMSNMNSIIAALVGAGLMGTRTPLARSMGAIGLDKLAQMFASDPYKAALLTNQGNEYAQPR